MGDSYAESLARFKENEPPEVVLFIADDPALMKIAVAWTTTTTSRTQRATALSDESENQTWRWLWTNTEYSRDELIQKSGISSYQLDSKLDLLIGNRILYPDGTINSFVQRYLRDKVLKLFDAKPKRRANKST